MEIFGSPPQDGLKKRKNYLLQRGTSHWALKRGTCHGHRGWPLLFYGESGVSPLTLVERRKAGLFKKGKKRGS